MGLVEDRRRYIGFPNYPVKVVVPRSVMLVIVSTLPTELDHAGFNKLENAVRRPVCPKVFGISAEHANCEPILRIGMCTR